MSSPFQSTTPTSPVQKSGDPVIDALLGSSQWRNIATAPTVISFSFPGFSDETAWHQSGYSSLKEWSSWSPFPRTGQDIVRYALQTWSQVANIEFLETDDTETEVGDIRIAFTDVDYDDAYAWSYLPNAFWTSGGDVWIDVEFSDDFSEPLEEAKGGYGLSTMVHELGHALGLKHPFEGKTKLPSQENWYGYSIMSYSQLPGHKDLSLNYYPISPSVYDILAVQYLYGANTAFHRGDDIYRYSDQQHYYETLWDAGGVDVLSYQGNLEAGVIDLREGQASRLGLAQSWIQDVDADLAAQSVWIAFGAVIENAVGGDGNDRLIGNAANNRLQGGLGADSLSGGAGGDIFVLGSADDSTLDAFDTISAFDPQDRIELQGANDLHWIDQAVSYQTTVTQTLTYIAANPAYANSIVQFDGEDGHYLLVNGDGLGEGNRFDGTLLRFTSGVIVREGQMMNPVGDEHQPQLAKPLADQAVWVRYEQDFSFSLPSDSFRDDDGEDLLSYSATLADGSPLPSWLRFDAERLRFSGTQSSDSANPLALRLIASDGVTSVADEFILDIQVLNEVIAGDGNDKFRGTAAADWLDGGKGADTMTGGSGDDVYAVDHVRDSVIESGNQGKDTVIAAVSYRLPKSVENLHLTGRLPLQATGNELANVLQGNAGHNRLAGGLGNDTLEGGAGRDTFVFNTQLAGNNLDTLPDFSPGEDRIELDRKIFKKLATISFAAEPGLQAMPRAGVFLFQDTDSGVVYYDGDGIGHKPAVSIAVVGVMLEAGDFV